MRGNRGQYSFCTAAVIAGTLLATSAAQAAYRTIDIYGDPAAEWADIPTAGTSIVNQGVFTDFATLSIANDSDYVYIKLTYHVAVNPQANSGVYLAIDSDNNLNTGFNVFGLGIIGSEAGFSNNFPFSQGPGAGDWNNQAGLSGPTPQTVLYESSAYNMVTDVQQIRIPLSTINNATGLPIFGSTFKLMAYTDGTGLDYIGAATYSLAAVPEPASIGILAIAGSALLLRRK